MRWCLRGSERSAKPVVNRKDCSLVERELAEVDIVLGSCDQIDELSHFSLESDLSSSRRVSDRKGVRE